MLSRVRSQKQEPAVGKLLEDYQTLLERARAHASAHRDLEKEFVLDPMAKIWKEANDEALPRRISNAIAMMPTTTTSLELAPSRGACSDCSPARTRLLSVTHTPNPALGVLLEAKVQAEVRKTVMTRWEDYSRTAAPEYEARAQRLNELFAREMPQESEALRAKAAATVKRLSQSNGWTLASLPFGVRDPRPEDRRDDPLYPLRLSRAEDLPRGQQERSSVHEKQARGILERIPLIPKDAVYRPFRALCYGTAGQEANRAATLRLGQGGLLQTRDKDLDGLTKLGVEAWENYVRWEDKEKFNAAVLHQLVLAYAHAGSVGKACGWLQQYQDLWTGSSDPALLYDVARVWSVRAGQPPRVGMPPDAALLASGTALQRAVWLGFREFEQARTDPDLKNLRSTPAFDRIIPRE
jgi:hypothetical protein